MYARPLLTLFLLIPSIAFASEADLWRESLTALQQGRFTESAKLYRRLIDLNPQKPLYWFNAGIAYYQIGDFRRAEICFRNVEKLNSPLTPAARLYRSKALLKSQRPSSAERLLRYLIAASDTPPGIRAEAKQDLSDLTTMLNREREEEKSAWLFLEGALGGGPKGPASNANLSLGYRFWSKEDWYANAGYNGWLSEAFDHSDLSVRAHELRGNIARESDRILLLLSPYLLHESYGGTAARLAEGVTAKVRYSPDPFEFGADVGVSTQQKGSSDYDYLAGQTLGATLYSGWIGEPVYIRLTFSFDKKAIGDQTFSDGRVIPMAYSSIGTELRSLWRLSPLWFADSSIQFSRRSYFTVAKPGSETREDQDLSLSIRVSRRIKSGLFAFLSGSHRSNQSTLGPSSVKNENFTESQALLGMAWDAL